MSDWKHDETPWMLEQELVLLCETNTLSDQNFDITIFSWLPHGLEF
jgi:hypothetical protein